jgi:hypothetical protein
MPKDNNHNPEVEELGTHAAGMETQHRTRNTKEKQTIEEPVVKNPGPYDTRTGNFE